MIRQDRDNSIRYGHQLQVKVPCFSIALIQFAFLALGIPEECRAQQHTPPNIILIVTDDQGYADLSAYDHASPGCHTPHMDRLAETGVLFTHAYATAPVCSPSRVAMLTGKYQGCWDSLMYWTPGL